VGIIAVILVRDLYVRTFAWSATSNRQYIATDRSSAYFPGESSVDNLRQHVDLGFITAAKWVVSNVGDVLRLLARHGFQNLEIAVRWLLRHGRRLVELLYNWVVLPAARQVKAIVLIIWYSPVLSTLAACVGIYLLWAHHAGTYRWATLEWVIGTATTGGLELLTHGEALALEYGGLAAGHVYRYGSVGVGVVAAVLDNTKEQLVAAAEAGDLESPRLAWVVWIVIVAATKSQAEIRLKTLAWPFVVLWVTALAGGAQWLPQVMLGVLVWCGAAIRVRTSTSNPPFACALLGLV
jgi:hypothetical protein